MPHVFISYSTQDAAYADALTEKLRSEGFDVWIDTDQLRSSSDWWRSIVSAIWECSAFIVILSPHSDASEWVQREIAIAEHKDKRWFPLLLSGDLDTINWQIFLHTQYEDVRSGQLPPPKFYDELAQVAERKAVRGTNVTEALPDSAPPLADPAAQRFLNDPPALHPPGTRRWLPIGALLVVLIVLGGLAISLALNPAPSTSTATPPITQPATNAPTIPPATHAAATTAASENGVVTEGIDVSQYNPNIDWTQVRQAGIAFAFARATYGTLRTDSDFAANWQGMGDAQVIRGAYHTYRADDDATDQANYFLAALGQVDYSDGDLPPVLDLVTNNQDYRDSIAFMTSIITWLNTVEAATGRKPILYLNPSFWNNSVSGSQFGGYPIWIANYGASTPLVPNGWATWTFWQYTNNTSVPGIATQVDGDRFNGSLEQLQAFIAGTVISS